jgi:uncharacterized protein YggE
MKKIILPVILLFISVYSISQTGGNAIYNENNNSNSKPGEVDLSLDNYSYDFSTILEANVMINVKATAFVAIFSLTQTGKTIEETEAAMSSRIDSFRGFLRQSNIDPKQIFVDPVTLVPTYEIAVENKRFSRTYNELPSGFEMKKNVHIQFKEHEQINSLIAAAAQAEIYDLVKVDYVVGDMNAILDELRNQALKILFSKKEIIEKTGISLRFSQVREKYGSVYPIERYAEYYAYKAGVTPAFASNYKRAPQQVQYNYAEKNKTLYYDQVSYKQFDKVINPVVGEPQVQIYLTLKGQYQVYDPESEADIKAYDKKMKELQQIEMELRLEEKRKDRQLKGRLPAKPVKK